MIVKWRIYYGDKTEVEGTTLEEWKNAPKYNVQIILTKDKNGKIEKWNSQEIYSLDDVMSTRITNRDSEVKKGEWLSDEIFHPLYDKSKEDAKVF